MLKIMDDPLFIICYINYLPTAITCNAILYADDTMLFFTMHTVSDCNNLQQDLNTLSHWVNMSFNADKYEYMTITLKHIYHTVTP